jgi:hypothetical protein
MSGDRGARRRSEPVSSREKKMAAAQQSHAVRTTLTRSVRFQKDEEGRERKRSFPVSVTSDSLN